jgi:hypothetical protein
VVTTQQYEKMTVYISLGRDKSEFQGMNKELSDAWDRLAIQIKEIQAAGGSVEIVSEMVDFVDPIED